MTLSQRIRKALAITPVDSLSTSATNSSHDGESPSNYPISQNSGVSGARSRRPISNRTSHSSTASTVVSLPALHLKKTFSNLRGSRKMRKEVRHQEALARWAAADEREWEHPTWDGPVKRSRKFSREQRDSLRNWGWNQGRTPSSPFESRRRSLSIHSEISPNTSPHNSYINLPPCRHDRFGSAGQNSLAIMSSRHAVGIYAVFGND